MALYCTLPDDEEALIGHPACATTVAISLPPVKLRELARFIVDVAREMEEKEGHLSEEWHRHFDPYPDSDESISVGFPGVWNRHFDNDESIPE